MYKCKFCGQEFENKYKLGGHSTRCKQNPNYERNKKNCNNLNVNNHKNKKPLLTGKKEICQYCGKEYGVYGLKTHEKYCEENPNHIEYPLNNHLQYYRSHPAWNKGLTAKDDIRIQQSSEKIRQYYETHDNYWKGKHLTEDTKEKLRISCANRLNKLYPISTIRTSKTACEYIDKLNEEKHWNLQHGFNGGEVVVLGYFLDGYDKDLNIVFEYDEPRHYIDIVNNVLCEKDIIRQNKIINELHCEFWRYNEKMDLLYKVN